MAPILPKRRASAQPVLEGSALRGPAHQLKGSDYWGQPAWTEPAAGATSSYVDGIATGCEKQYPWP